MRNSAKSASAERRPRRPAEPPANHKLMAVRRAVREFLAGEFEAREVRLTKIARSPDGADGWRIEAEMLVPDLGIKTLGLPLTQEVLEKEYCAIELDPDLTIRSYEIVGFDERS